MPADQLDRAVSVLDLKAAITAALPDGFPWQLETSPRLKHARMEVRDGVLVVRVGPIVPTPADLAGSVARQGPPLLYRAKRTRHADVAPEVTKQLVNGEGFVLLGRSYRLKIVDAGAPCEIRRQPIGQRRPGDDEQGSMGSDLFLCLRRDKATPATVIAWYQRQLREYLDTHLPPLADRLGVDPGLTWKVRPHCAARGGSWALYATGRHEITVRWQVAQFPRELLDHVLRHEAVHASRVHWTRRGGSGKPHGREFQSKMDILNPGWRDLEKRARTRIGAEVWNGRLTPAAGHVSGWGDNLIG